MCDNDWEDLLPNLSGQLAPIDLRSKRMRGGYADVWQSFWRGKPVAVKVIMPVDERLKTMRRKIRREAIIWHRLQHPNILPLLGFVDSEEFQPFGGFVSPLFGTMQGVVYLHTRTPPFVHGDIKPTNIVIDDSGIPKLCDFGLSRIFREASDPPTGLTTTTAYTGTSRYLAIELVDPNEIVTPTLKTDIWALGCFIFSEEPYQNRVNSVQIFEDIRKGVPPTKFPDDIATEYQGIAKILDDCWARIPSERPDALTLTGKMLKFFPTCANKQPVSEVHSTIPQNIITGFSGAIREEKIAASSDLGIPVSIPIEHKGRIFEDNGSSSSRGNTNTISVGNDPGSLRSKVHHGYRLARLDIPRLQSLTFSIPAALNPNPALAMGGRTKKTCKECGQPGRYEGNKCVERWEFSAYGPSTVCEQCHKINWWLEKWGNQKAQAGTAKKHNRHPRSPTLSISSSRSSDQHSAKICSGHRATESAIAELPTAPSTALAKISSKLDDRLRGERTTTCPDIQGHIFDR
ncbi:kinase-like protein [Serendipita vermifera]|nr:kinase-like protein [Serendipita vermifera]